MKIKILIIFLSAIFFACQGNKKDNNFEKEIISSENIQRGAGKFKVEGGFVKTDSITIHYYHPNNFKKTSPIIFVLPGGGRNGDDYRDSWIKKAKEFGIMIPKDLINEAGVNIKYQ